MGAKERALGLHSVTNLGIDKGFQPHYHLTNPLVCYNSSFNHGQALLWDLSNCNKRNVVLVKCKL